MYAFYLIPKSFIEKDNGSSHHSFLIYYGIFVTYFIDENIFSRNFLDEKVNEYSNRKLEYILFILAKNT